MWQISHLGFLLVSSLLVSSASCYPTRVKYTAGLASLPFPSALPCHPPRNTSLHSPENDLTPKGCPSEHSPTQEAHPKRPVIHKIPPKKKTHKIMLKPISLLPPPDRKPEQWLPTESNRPVLPKPGMIGYYKTPWTPVYLKPAPEGGKPQGPADKEASAHPKPQKVPVEGVDYPKRPVIQRPGSELLNPLLEPGNRRPSHNDINKPVRPVIQHAGPPITEPIPLNIPDIESLTRPKPKPGTFDTRPIITKPRPLGQLFKELQGLDLPIKVPPALEPRPPLDVSRAQRGTLNAAVLAPRALVPRELVRKPPPAPLERPLRKKFRKQMAKRPKHKKYRPPPPPAHHHHHHKYQAYENERATIKGPKLEGDVTIIVSPTNGIELIAPKPNGEYHHNHHHHQPPAAVTRTVSVTVSNPALALPGPMETPDWAKSILANAQAHAPVITPVAAAAHMVPPAVVAAAHAHAVPPKPTLHVIAETNKAGPPPPPERVPLTRKPVPNKTLAPGATHTRAYQHPIVAEITPQAVMVPMQASSVVQQELEEATNIDLDHEERKRRKDARLQALNMAIIQSAALDHSRLQEYFRTAALPTQPTPTPAPQTPPVRQHIKRPRPIGSILPRPKRPSLGELVKARGH